ncbi:unnamed protein product [Paramecium pentaurelia]|uniref:Uncharacterized protein n=1 Tax=Paramecium pentaurelia TaxID=43138 RepID=A0A8S1T498_9CILI|nr:unnamed protein product [Paramecium pentaurelia]
MDLKFHPLKILKVEIFHNICNCHLIGSELGNSHIRGLYLDGRKLFNCKRRNFPINQGME